MNFKNKLKIYEKVTGNKLIGYYKNGNHYTALFTNGTKIKETIDESADHFTYDFPENFDIHINNRCNAGCIYCHEGSNPNGEVPSLINFVYKDFNKKIYTPLYNSILGGTEMAIGGGNIFESDKDDLFEFLNANKKKHIVSNVTINQKHVVENLNTIKNWIDNDLVHGIGISLVDSSDNEFINAMKDLYDNGYGNNIVIHVINGILTEKDVDFLKDKKVLILGYKDLRRGHNVLQTKLADEIKQNQQWLAENLGRLNEQFKLISFDCLAIEQLNPKKLLNISDADWNELYQGSDTDVLDKDNNISCATMYIDLVNNTCARMSTAALDKRYAFTYDESISDLLKKSIQGW